jgi:hypothetical protein
VNAAVVTGRMRDRRPTNGNAMRQSETSVAMAVFVAVLVAACERDSTTTPATTTAPEPTANAPAATSDVQDDSAATLQIRGDFTSTDLDAIKRAIRHEDPMRPLMALSRLPDDEVEVWTGDSCGPLCGSGKTYRLRKIDGTWTVVQRASWAS